MSCPVTQQFPNLFELIALKTSVSATKINPAVEMGLYPEVLPAAWISWWETETIAYCRLQKWVIIKVPVCLGSDDLGPFRHQPSLTNLTLTTALLTVLLWNTVGKSQDRWFILSPCKQIKEIWDVAKLNNQQYKMQYCIFTRENNRNTKIIVKGNL